MAVLKVVLVSLIIIFEVPLIFFIRLLAFGSLEFIYINHPFFAGLLASQKLLILQFITLQILLLKDFFIFLYPSTFSLIFCSLHFSFISFFGNIQFVHLLFNYFEETIVIVLDKGASQLSVVAIDELDKMEDKSEKDVNEDKPFVAHCMKMCYYCVISFYLFLNSIDLLLLSFLLLDFIFFPTFCSLIIDQVNPIIIFSFSYFCLDFDFHHLKNLLVCQSESELYFQQTLLDILQQENHLLTFSYKIFSFCQYSSQNPCSFLRFYRTFQQYYQVIIVYQSHIIFFETLTSLLYYYLTYLIQKGLHVLQKDQKANLWVGYDYSSFPRLLILVDIYQSHFIDIMVYFLPCRNYLMILYQSKNFLKLLTHIQLSNLHSHSLLLHYCYFQHYLDVNCLNFNFYKDRHNCFCLCYQCIVYLSIIVLCAFIFTLLILRVTMHYNFVSISQSQVNVRHSFSISQKMNFHAHIVLSLIMN